ncbi:MAG: hypothetical protein MUO97_00555, partial [Dehalococcoidia bacterium]|nr:hypothetical protein [Dehalococcoidia bacterium]
FLLRPNYPHRSRGLPETSPFLLMGAVVSLVGTPAAFVVGSGDFLIPAAAFYLLRPLEQLDGPEGVVREVGLLANEITPPS